MTIKRWYQPNWCGDFRLEAHEEDEEKSVLHVKNPTPAELYQLGEFLAQARKKKWVTKAAGVMETGETVLTLTASVNEAGRLLLGEDRLKTSLLTAVKHEGGELSIVAGGSDEQIKEAVEEETATEAVTTPRPTCCCPSPVEAREQRASEVLRAFCTQPQWQSWQEKGYLTCRGGFSGHLYRVAHRNSPIAARQGKITWDMADDCVIHCHVSWLPPPEEVLAVKLTLEHAEDWVRNRSGALGGTHRVRYKNPHMPEHNQAGDGIPDTNFIRGIGDSLRQMIRLLGGPK